ncbi:MAG TPA: hypothetical protein DC054_05635, partial [Blastocatellia bacterium]|nr:hypothetical protein [Blastocatellia bacterium]
MRCPKIPLRQLALQPRLEWLLQRGPIALVILTFGLFPFLVYALFNPRTVEPAVIQPASLARLSETVSVRAASRDNPTIKLSDGHDVLTSYVGPEDLRMALEQNRAQPLSLACADFDEDGVPDLVSGYSYKGQGIVSVLRGNVDSIYPNSPDAIQRKANGTLTDPPFLSPARVFPAPVAADFVGAGDFDGDGHWDLVIAARTASMLYLLSGDGGGGLTLTRQVPLPGNVTAMSVGEINRPDGLPDIVIGGRDLAGPYALVFEGPEGALRAEPERFELPSAPAAFAIGQFEGSPDREVVIAAGSELAVIEGRDRKLSLNAGEKSKVAPAAVTLRAMPYAITALAAGDFIWDSAHNTDLALLDTNGSVHFLSVTSDIDAATPRRKLGWGEQRTVSLGTISSSASSSAKPSLVTARLSAHQTDDLLMVGTGQEQIRLVNADPARRDETGQLLDADGATTPTATALNAETTVTAVLPMRLNEAALSSLVILRNDETAPSIVPQAPVAIITVNSSDDTNVRDNVLTLREAILLANGGTSANGGLSKAELTPAEQAQVQGTPNGNQLDEVRFNIAVSSFVHADNGENPMSTDVAESQILSQDQFANRTEQPFEFERPRSRDILSPAGLSDPRWFLQSRLGASPKLDREAAIGFRAPLPRELWTRGSVNDLLWFKSGIQLAPIYGDRGSRFTLAPDAPGQFPAIAPLSTLTQKPDADNALTSQPSLGSSQVTSSISPDAFSCSIPAVGPLNTIVLGNGGINPYSVAVSDFNGDGKLDVVTANQDSDNITIRLGNGAGGFGVPNNISLGSGPIRPLSVAVGDLNGDGRPDVVTANSISTKVSVLLGNGAGGFATPIAFDLGPGVNDPASVVLSDLNGDGRLDVITANRISNNITVLLGNGAGGFGIPNSFS